MHVYIHVCISCFLLLSGYPYGQRRCSHPKVWSFTAWVSGHVQLICLQPLLVWDEAITPSRGVQYVAVSQLCIDRLQGLLPTDVKEWVSSYIYTLLGTYNFDIMCTPSPLSRLYQCPQCYCSLVDMSTSWQRMDEERDAWQMPHHLRNFNVKVIQ